MATETFCCGAAVLDCRPPSRQAISATAEEVREGRQDRTLRAPARADSKLNSIQPLKELPTLYAGTLLLRGCRCNVIRGRLYRRPAVVLVSKTTDEFARDDFRRVTCGPKTGSRQGLGAAGRYLSVLPAWVVRRMMSRWCEAMTRMCLKSFRLMIIRLQPYRKFYASLRLFVEC